MHYQSQMNAELMKKKQKQMYFINMVYKIRLYCHGKYSKNHAILYNFA